MIRMSHGLGMPGTVAETYCLEGPKSVADSIVIGNRFGATDTFCLRPPGTATDTPSISRNIKYIQTPAETENIGSPETASGIGHTGYQFRPTYLLRIRYDFCSSYSGPYTNSIRSVFRGTYTSFFSEWMIYASIIKTRTRLNSYCFWIRNYYDRPCPSRNTKHAQRYHSPHNTGTRHARPV
jgi:hypothetical protein